MNTLLTILETYYFPCHHLKLTGKIILPNKVSTTKLSHALRTDTSASFHSFITDICSHFELCSRTFQDQGFLGDILFRVYDPSRETALKMAFPASLTLTHSHRKVIHPVFLLSTNLHNSSRVRIGHKNKKNVLDELSRCTKNCDEIIWIYGLASEKR